MIRLIEALNYRCLKYTKRTLENFQVLVGPNASGKTTFLDVVSFLGDLVSEGPEKAINERTSNFQDLLWGRAGDKFELAIELDVPEQLLELIFDPAYSVVRYEVEIGNNEQTNDQQAILAEKVLLKTSEDCERNTQREIFPEDIASPSSIISKARANNTRSVVNKVPGGNDNFYSEIIPQKGKGWAPAFKLGPYKSALGNLPADEEKFPVATWLRGILMEGIQQIVLNSAFMRKPSPPGLVKGFRPDGSNLPWVIQALQSGHEEKYRDWIEHLATALPDIRDILIYQRPEDRHCYLMVKYKDGLKIPSWMVSDGTLRLLALTLPAYLPDLKGIFLIEEPENGIHPHAVETVFQSLSSVYDAQILIATHSPVMLSQARSEQVLCFSKTECGATDIVSGNEHPALRDWKGETNLSVLYAGGVLG